MKLAWTAFALSLVVGLACLSGPAQAAQASLLQPRDAHARCLCGYDLRITTLPASPRQDDDVQVVCTAVWSDSCVPMYSSHEMRGRLIQVYALCNVPPEVGCLTVLTPFRIVADAGRLQAGTHQVEWYITDRRFGEWPTLCATGEFSVRPAMRTIYLPMVLRGA